MKIITMYLPQFYETKLNNKWWGDGFTEWTTVSNAEPLFEGHNQPRKPMNCKYYNLLDKKTMIWQAELMEKYNIYGQCFYHYWFKDGKRTLEKPAENLLKWKDINMRFCFSWANESWVRSWSAMMDANIWSQKFEPSESYLERNGILLEQGYGNESDWREHFDYLIPFFKDQRYIKIEGKPVFMFYRPDNVPILPEMVQCWHRWSIEQGFPGMYFIGANTSSKGCLDATYIHATGSVFPSSYYKVNNSVKTISYEKVWTHILAQAGTTKKGTYVGGIVGFDTTPRKGKSGIVITECSDLIYETFLRQLLKLNEELENKFTFINAWNEWGEGMYLEPDETNSYKFLEATKRALDLYKYEDIKNDDKNYGQLLTFYKDKMEHYKKIGMILDQWMKRKEQNNSLGIILKKKGINTIAIYGLGILGEHLKTELEETDIVISYVIDIRKQGIKRNVPILGLNDMLPEADAIIVSVTNEFYKIQEELKRKTNIPILSLEDILFEQEDID